MGYWVGLRETTDAIEKRKIFDPKGNLALFLGPGRSMTAILGLHVPCFMLYYMFHTADMIP
jgi:hypothetical protein